MRCHVYKSLRKDDTYLYLSERDGFGCLPEALRTALGPLDFVLELDLAPGRRLARVDAGVVRANLAACGFHLQLPPTAADADTGSGSGSSAPGAAADERA